MTKKRKDYTTVIRKRLLPMILTVAMVLGLFTWGPLAPEENVKEAKAAVTPWDGSTRTAPTGGGTESNPYLIASGANLAYLAQQVNGGTNYQDKFFCLTEDIDLNNKNWTPIGNSLSFNGRFYGKGHTIKNVKIDASSAASNTYWGLFGQVNGGIVSGVNITGASYTHGYKAKYVGGIVGYAKQNCRILNCTFAGTISANTSNLNYAGVGGIVGGRYSADCSIEKCINYASVNGGVFTGGIIGNFGESSGSISIKECSNYGNIAGQCVSGATDPRCAGGIVGYIGTNSTNDQICVDCINRGEVSFSDTTSNSVFVGGIVGRIYSSSNNNIRRCINTGNVSATASKSKVGLIAGYLTNCTYEHCYVSTGPSGNLVGQADTGAINTGSDKIDLTTEGNYDNSYAFDTVWKMGTASAELQPTVALYASQYATYPDTGATSITSALTKSSEITTNNFYGEIMLLTNVTEDITYSNINGSGKDTRYLDLNGYNITGTRNSSVITVNSGTLVVKNSAGLGNGGEISGGTGTVIDISQVGAKRVGGGVYVSNGEFRLTDGVKIADNTAALGAGVYSDKKLSMSKNTKICNNTATESGGGIYSSDGSNTLSITAGEITDNYAPVGAGVYFNGSTFNLGDTGDNVPVVIKDNKTDNTSTGKPRNLELASGKHIQFDGLLSDDEIHFYVTDDTQTAFPYALNDANGVGSAFVDFITREDAPIFTMDSNKYGFEAVDRESTSYYDVYAIKLHTHEWYGFNASDNIITATCKDTDHGHGSPATGTLKIDASDDDYTGVPYDAATKITLTDGLELDTQPTVHYKKGTADLGETPPTEPGNYSAYVTLSGTDADGISYNVTALDAFTINGFHIGNDDYPYGTNMTSSSVTLNIVRTGASSYQWQKRADDALSFTDIDSATSHTYTFNPSGNNGTWYRCKINGSIYSKAVQVIQPNTSADLYGRIWTRPRSGNPWYLSNGTMAYTSSYNNSSNTPYFDVVGAFTKNGKTYMLQTSYGGGGWKMYTSTSENPTPSSYSSGSGSFEDVRFAFSDDRYILNIEADMVSGQKSFSFGCDTQLGNSATSGSYADYAALAAERNSDNTLKQIAMIGAASKEAAKDTDPAFVIAPVGIKSSESGVLDSADFAPLYWLGMYYSRVPFGVATDVNSSTKKGGLIKATNHADVPNGVVTAQQLDTGMTMSWINAGDGKIVKFRFSVGDAASTGAITGNVDYGNEKLKIKDATAGQVYTVTDGAKTVYLTTNTQGEISLAGKDNNNTEFDFFGKTITVTKESMTPFQQTLQARPTARIGNMVTSRAPRPIDIKGAEIESDKNSITISLDPRSTDTVVKQKLKQEYRIYNVDGEGAESAIDGYSWITPDSNGRVVFSGLNTDKKYAIRARVTATSSAPTSHPVSVQVKTKPNFTVTPPVTVNKNTDITLTTTGVGSVKYAAALDDTYKSEKLQFSTSGLHTVYYRLDFANVEDTVYGSFDVKINPTVTFDPNGGTLTGSGLSGDVPVERNVTYGQTLSAANLSGASATKTTGDLQAFAGWYEDKHYANLWDATDMNHTPIIEDITLYARWGQSLYSFNNNDMQGVFDWTTVTTLQLFKGNVPASNEVTVNGGVFNFTDIPADEYQLVIKMNDEHKSKTISTLCTVRAADNGNDCVVTAAPITSDKNISSKVKVEPNIPNFLVGKLDKETKENEDTYWDLNYIKMANDTSEDSNVIYSVDLTFHAKTVFDWTKVNITEDVAAAHLTQDEQELRSKEFAIFNKAKTEGASGLKHYDLSVTHKVLQQTTIDGETSNSVLGERNIDSTREVLEIVVPYDTTDIEPKVYRMEESVARSLTKITSLDRPVTEYTDGTYYVANNYIVIYTNRFGNYAIGAITEAPDPAIGYGFVDYTTEKFKDKSMVGGSEYDWDDYEISTTESFADGTILSVGNLVNGNGEVSKTYYIRSKAKGNKPESIGVPFTIKRPNAPAEGLFSFVNSSDGSNGSIRLNDTSIASTLQYKSESGSWVDFPTGGVIDPVSNGSYSFRFKPDVTSGLLQGAVMTHAITTEEVALSDVTIRGEATVGSTLLATPVGADNKLPTGVTYQWYRVLGETETAIPSATNSSYTLIAADLGYEIKVKATQSSTSVEKSAKTAPIKPMAGSLIKPTVERITKTENSIMVDVTNDGNTKEYSIDGGLTWQSGNSFSGLSSDTIYTVMIRDKGETATVGGKTVVTKEPGAATTVSVRTDAPGLALRSVTIKNLSASGGNTSSTLTVYCGDALKAFVEDEGISGVTYQWYWTNADDTNPTLISGATSAVYYPTASDIGKKIKVVVTKGSNVDDITAGTVTKAPAASAPTLTSDNITKTNDTITVKGFTDNTERSITYQYSIDGGVSWQDSNVFTGLDPNQTYNVSVRVKGDSAREAGQSSTAVPITTDRKPMPFNEGSTPAVIIPDYSYGETPPVPSLNIGLNDGAGDVTYYYSADGKTWLPCPIPGTLVPGTYYSRAVVASTNNFEGYTTEMTPFTVKKGVATTSLISVSVEEVENQIHATVTTRTTGKALEYTVVPSNSSLVGAKWSNVITDSSKVVVKDDGTFEIPFEITRTLAADTEYKVYVREKEQTNYLASTPVASDGFTLSNHQFTVVYKANGGYGELPPQVISSTSVTVDHDWDKLIRVGYYFGGWANSASSTTRVTGDISSAKTLYAIWIPIQYNVEFEENDGSSVSDISSQEYDSLFALPTPTKAGSSFAGWSKSDTAVIDFQGGQRVKNLATENGATVKLYAVWGQVGTITGQIGTDDPDTATVRLMKGDIQWSNTMEVTFVSNSVTGKAYTGVFEIGSVPYGDYNLVIEQVVDGETLVKTQKITVNSPTLNLENIVLPASTHSRLAISGDDTPKVVVGGLDELAALHAIKNRNVLITMTVEKKQEMITSEESSDEDKEIQDAITAIKADENAGENTEQEFLDIRIDKEVSLNGQTESTIRVTDTVNPMEIILPYDMTGKTPDKVFVLRFHGRVENFRRLASGPATLSDKSFWITGIGRSAQMHISGSLYSVYAIVYNTSSTQNSSGIDTSGEGGGSGAGGGTGGNPTPGIAPVINDSTNGTVTIEPQNPIPGKIVTIKPFPNDGYKVGEVRVIGPDGKPIPVTPSGDGTYTYTQPEGKVTIDVGFEKDNKNTDDGGEEDQGDTEKPTANGKTAYENALSINSKLKVSQTGSKISIGWGKVNGADRYEVFAAYCGEKPSKKPYKVVKNGKLRLTIKKLNGKKLNLKKNYKFYVVAYKMVNGKKKKLGKTVTAHIVGRKNKKYSNPKKLTVKKSKFTLYVGKSAKIKASVVLVNQKKKSLSDKHAPKFRYASALPKIVSVSKNGKIKALAKGKVTIWVYAKNGYAKKVKVTIK